MNPVIWRQGVCDPHIKIFNGKAYLYASHDNQGYGRFHMEDWQIWSSSDLVNWKLEDTIYPENFYCGHIDQCWALDAACKNGKYYLYFSVYYKEIGVGISSFPGGPFTDALGKALVNMETPPVDIRKWDPCVFVDDDGAAYLICGSTLSANQAYLIARMNEDMISLAEPLKDVICYGDLQNEDKPSIHKYNGIYYLSHASYYATAQNVYGPYAHRGNTGANIDHGSYFTYKNQTYNASGGMDNPSRFFRASFLVYCHYKDNGEIIIDQKPLEYGVGQYDASWDRIEAEWFFESSGTSKKECPNGGFEIRDINNGDYLYFQNVNNVETNTTMEFHVSSNNPEGGVLEVREVSQDGVILGCCPVPYTGSWSNYTTIPCNLINTAGVKQIYFVFRGAEGEELLRLDWFTFNSTQNKNSYEAEKGVLSGSAAVKNDTSASCCQIVNNMHLVGSAVTVFVDGYGGGNALMKIKYSNGSSETSQLSLYVNGDHTQQLSFPNTGSWSISNPPSEITTIVV